MRIATLVEPGRFEIRDEPEPPIADDELLVRVAACERQKHRAQCSVQLSGWVPLAARRKEKLGAIGFALVTAA